MENKTFSVQIARRSAAFACMAASILMLFGCDGDSNSEPVQNIPVTSAESPIPNTTGVRISLNDGGYIYALSSDENASSATIKRDDKKSSGDLSLLVDNTFFEFSNISQSAETKVALNANISAAYECSLESKRCSRVPIKVVGDHRFFIAHSGYFYAIEK